jgi:hypothetical protein
MGLLVPPGGHGDAETMRLGPPEFDAASNLLSCGAL